MLEALLAMVNGAVGGLPSIGEVWGWTPGGK